MSIKDKVQSLRTRSVADGELKEVLKSIADSIEAIEKELEVIKKAKKAPVEKKSE